MNEAPWPDRLPPLEGTTLSGRPMRFPVDLPEHPVVLVVGFTHGARHDVGAWKAALARRGVPFLSLPTSATDLAPKDLAEVAQAMRAHVPENLQDQVVQIHRGGQALCGAFGWAVDHHAKVLLVQPSGQVQARHDTGPFSESAMLSFMG